ncbi:unnamed protein product [Heligmosomoides polygyrus]|uniref:Uncharacterized protein n=1 Tax=Heligmosomoides polygyrus TaxID=6339 RepID=A0A183GJ54_HELPZ|nr:unnamed protein product [Heligmosomoides polygyrus]
MTEYLTTDENESRSIKVNIIELQRTSVIKYLGLAIASDGGLNVEANSRVSAALFKWRSLTEVLCDKKIPERLKYTINNNRNINNVNYGNDLTHYDINANYINYNDNTNHNYGANFNHGIDYNYRTNLNH